jgi:hypothetical protein
MGSKPSGTKVFVVEVLRISWEEPLVIVDEDEEKTSSCGDWIGVGLKRESRLGFAKALRKLLYIE